MELQTLIHEDGIGKSMGNLDGAHMHSLKFTTMHHLSYNGRTRQVPLKHHKDSAQQVPLIE